MAVADQHENELCVFSLSWRVPVGARHSLTHDC
jgi:hypothetical protein